MTKQIVLGSYQIELDGDTLIIRDLDGNVLSTIHDLSAQSSVILPNGALLNTEQVEAALASASEAIVSDPIADHAGVNEAGAQAGTSQSGNNGAILSSGGIFTPFHETAGSSDAAEATGSLEDTDAEPKIDATQLYEPEETATIHINPAPVAADSTVHVLEDHAIAGTVKASDSDALAYSLIDGPQHGTLDFNEDGSYVYTPFENFNGTDSFSWKANDGNSDSGASTVTLEVAPDNDAPVSRDETVSQNEDIAITGILPVSDVDGDILTYNIIQDPRHGSLVINLDGTYVYTPDVNFNGTDSFIFQAIDNGAFGIPLSSTLATVTINVNPVNDAPEANDSTLSVLEGDLAVGFVAAVDPEGDLITKFTLLDQPSAGQLLFDPDLGEYIFDASKAFEDLAQGEHRDVTFTYAATDALGATSAPATVTMTVTGTNDAPTAPTVLMTAEDGAPTIGSFGADDVDSDNDPSNLSYWIIYPPIQGSVTFNDDGTFTFDPGEHFRDLKEGESRDTWFLYGVTDTHGASAANTVVITVSGRNDAPEIQDSTITVLEGDLAVGFVAAVDPEGDLITKFTLLDQPSAGQLLFDPDLGAYIFDASKAFEDLAQGKHRDVTFTYAATDALGAISEPATVTITVTGQNDAPATQDQHITTTDDSKITVAFAADDVDGDNDGSNLAYAVATLPSEGTLADNGDGTFTFDPGKDFLDLKEGETRDVTFTYQVIDAHAALSNVSTVTITVTGQNNAPVHSIGTGTFVGEDGSNTGKFGVADPDGDALTFTITANTPRGRIVDNGDGTYTFFTDGDFESMIPGDIDQVEFQFDAIDSSGARLSSSGNIIVLGQNDAPVAQDQHITTTEDDKIMVAFAVDDVDSDNDPSNLFYAIQTQPSAGSFTNNGDGTFSFDPGAAFQDLKEGETRDVTFTYKTTDAHGANSNVSTVTITVTGENDAPVANSSSIYLAESAMFSLGLFDATDAEGDALTFVITDFPDYGQLIDYGYGSFSFVLTTELDFISLGETLELSFKFEAIDSHGVHSSPATNYIYVWGENDAPVSQDQHITTTEDDVVRVAFAAADVDSDNDTTNLKYSITQPSSGQGSVTDNADGTFSFDPANQFEDLKEGETRDVTFSYQAVDAHGAVSNTSTVTITVIGQNDAPITPVLGNAYTKENALLTFGFPAFDPEGDPLTYTITEEPELVAVVNHGSGFSVDTTKGFEFLAEGQIYADDLTYEVTDSHGATTGGEVRIIVLGQNDAPVAEDQVFDVVNGGSITIAFAADDVDSDNDTTNLKYSITQPPSGQGSVTDNGDGTFSFDPGTDFQDLKEGETRDVTFTYQAADAHGANSNISTVTITVVGQNDAPFAATSNEASQGGNNILSIHDLLDVSSDELDLFLTSTAGEKLPLDADVGHAPAGDASPITDPFVAPVPLPDFNNETIHPLI